MGKWPEGLKLGIGVPTSWPYMNTNTSVSLLTLEKPDFVYLDSPVQGGDIAEKREYQSAYAVEKGLTDVLFLDYDMVFPPNVLVDMFEVRKKYGADIVGGLCYRGYPPYEPLAFSKDGRPLLPFRDFKFGDVLDVGSTGAACLLVKTDVFVALERPWFRFETLERETIDSEGKKTVRVQKRGEDTYFTRRAFEAGFKIAIMTNYDIGHLREFSVDRHFWIYFGILNKVGSWKRIINLYRKCLDIEWVKRELGE